MTTVCVYLLCYINKEMWKLCKQPTRRVTKTDSAQASKFQYITLTSINCKHYSLCIQGSNTEDGDKQKKLMMSGSWHHDRSTIPGAVYNANGFQCAKPSFVEN